MPVHSAVDQVGVPESVVEGGLPVVVAGAGVVAAFDLAEHERAGHAVATAGHPFGERCVWELLFNPGSRGLFVGVLDLGDHADCVVVADAEHDRCLSGYLADRVLAVCFFHTCSITQYVSACHRRQRYCEHGS